MVIPRNKFSLVESLNLAPEVPNSLQTSNSSSSGAYSRSDSGEEKPTTSPSSLDTILLRARPGPTPLPLLADQQQSVIYGSSSRLNKIRNTFQKDCFQHDDPLAARQVHEHPWSFERSHIPSDHFNKHKYLERSTFHQQQQYCEHAENNRIDYLSLSLSPPVRRKELPFTGGGGGSGGGGGGHESLSLTPMKNIDVLNENDLHDIVRTENNCTGSQEDPQCYDVGGYMPISERDILGDKYEVCRKLGYGQFSTVWLCQNQLDDGYVAIKVSKSQPKLTALAKDEIKLLQCTNETNPDHPGYENMVKMLDFFCCQSINGNHSAIVLEVMGPSLLHLIKQSEYRGIQLIGVRRIIKQVLQGLQYLHEECGIIHTDLKPENILIKTKDRYILEMVKTAKKFNEMGIALPKTYVSSHRWNDADVDTTNDDYESVQLFRAKSYPEDPFLSELVSYRNKHSEFKLKGPMWIDANIEVKIGDMGNATWANNKYNSTIQTRQYRALEVILDAGYDCPADIWSAGCLAFELATGEYLFYPKLYKNFSLDVDHLNLIWEVLGGIPAYITKNGAKAEMFFNNAGKLRNIDEKGLRIWKIEDVLVDKYKWKRLDAIPFAGFIESLIEPDPSLRYTASTALSCEWIND